MNKTVKRIILIAIIIVVIVLAVILKKYREGVATIPSNDPMLVGNTAGNLYNNGYFVEDGGKVYFSNTYDGNNIYVMNPDQSDLKMIKYHITMIKYHVPWWKIIYPRLNP